MRDDEEGGDDAEAVGAWKAEAGVCKVGDEAWGIVTVGQDQTGERGRKVTDENTPCKVSQAQNGYLGSLPLGGFDVVVDCVCFGVKRLCDRTDVVYIYQERY